MFCPYQYYKRCPLELMPWRSNHTTVKAKGQASCHWCSCWHVYIYLRDSTYITFITASFYSIWYAGKKLWNVLSWCSHHENLITLLLYSHNKGFCLRSPNLRFQCVSCELVTIDRHCSHLQFAVDDFINFLWMSYREDGPYWTLNYSSLRPYIFSYK